MSHTEGKLHVGEGDEADHYILDERFNIVAIAGGIPPQVRQRLVTCWNEHDDLVKERDEWILRCAEANRQRDELIQAMLAIKEHIDDWESMKAIDVVVRILAKYPDPS